MYNILLTDRIVGTREGTYRVVGRDRVLQVELQIEPSRQDAPQQQNRMGRSHLHAPGHEATSGQILLLLQDPRSLSPVGDGRVGSARGGGSGLPVGPTQSTYRLQEVLLVTTEEGTQ